MAAYRDDSREWLEADGMGGFASGTVSGMRTRRYHALLLAATTPPTGRVVLVNGIEAWLETPRGRFSLSSQRYAPDVIHPDGATRVEDFRIEPFPTWTYRLEDGARLEHTIFVPHGQPLTVLTWQFVQPQETATLLVRPLLSGRDHHALHHENPAFRFDADVDGERVRWQPYADLPAIETCSNGVYQHAPLWFRNFQYDEERARGLDFTEDLASPGEFRWQLDEAHAVLTFAVKRDSAVAHSGHTRAAALAVRLSAAELKRRQQFASRLHRAADAYIVQRQSKTIIAGYPWFTDWGRDTFIALRGLCLAAGRLDLARDILLSWAATVSEGMLPNRFPDRGESPEYNSVDASLWYIIAVHDFLEAMDREGQIVPDDEHAELSTAVETILTGYSRGTRYGIRLDDDGLLAAGQPGIQLTWMDAKVGDWVVTPRIGKPVEIQALWLNALYSPVAPQPDRGSRSDSPTQWTSILQKGLKAFEDRFWNDADGCLYDVVDVDHQPVSVDATFRPNQIFAVGGLPLPLLSGQRARRVVDAVEARLWTPLGLRSLDPQHPAYQPYYEGGVWQRDGAYHQGTVWPWLIGPFVEAWVRVRGATTEAKREARRRFVEPLLDHLNQAGLGHISEIADADPPHTPRGCPFQAWSLGELLRVIYGVLHEDASTPSAAGSVVHRQYR